MKMAVCVSCAATAAFIGLWPATALAETITLDSMDANQAAWGAAGSAETELVQEGAGALRWGMDEGPLRRDDLEIDLSRYNSLRLWIYSPRATFARVKLDILSEAGDPVFWLTFKADWSGWNRMELPASRFRTDAPDAEAAWAEARGLALTQTEPGFEPGYLVLDGLEVSTDWPQIPVNDHETLIDWLYWSAEGLPLWKPTEETLAQAEGSCGLDRYWCWGYMWTIEDPATRDVCAYTRDFGTDITPYDTVEVRASNDTEGYLSVHLQVDGEWSTPVEFHKGTGHFEELQIALPAGGKQLDRVTLDISEPPGDIGGPAGRQVKCNIMWLLLRKPGTPKGSPPTPMPKVDPLALNGSLEEDGLPAGIYFGRGELPAVRKLFLEGAGRSVFDSARSRADGFLASSPEDYVGKWYPARNWASSRTDSPSFGLGRAAQTCALAYVVTGEKRYADHARRALLAASRIENWVSGLFARYPLGWGGHGNVFDESAISYDMALAYDWAYTAFSDEERRIVEDALLRKGIWWTYDSLKHSPGLLKMNQGAVFDSQMGCALLALEPNRSELRELREQAEEWLWSGITDYSLEDGVSNEGVGYWHYTWNTAVRLLAAMAERDPEAFLQRCPDKVKQAMDWLVHMKSSNSEGFQGVFFCDGGGGAPSPAVSAFFAKYLQSPTGAWFQAMHSGPNDLLSALMWEHDVEAQEPPMILARHFRGAGYVFLRDGFEYGDTLFTLLGGPRLAGHDQRDRTSFTIEAFGEHLAMDPGMISYDNPIHTSLANTRLHNAITIDGGEGRQEAQVVGFFSSPMLDYAAVDGTKAYPEAEHYVRKAIFLRPDHFVISDAILLKEPGRIEWNLNSAGELSVAGSRVLAEASAADLAVDFATPRELKMETEVWPCGYPGIENHHATLSSGETADAERFLVSLYPVSKGEADRVAVEPIAGERCAGLHIRRAALEDLVLERTTEDVARWENLQFTGEMAAIRLADGRLTGGAVINGTELRWQDRALVSAAGPGCYSVHYRDGWGVASVQAPAGTTVRVASSTGRPFGSLHVGSVAGGFVESDLERGADGAAFTVPEGEAPLAGYWLVFDRPEWLDLEHRSRPALQETLVDGSPLPTGGLPPGAVPDAVEMIFGGGSNPLDPASVWAYFDGRRLTPEQYSVRSLDDGAAAVSVPVKPLLGPEELEPEFYTTHTVEVELRDRSLVPRRGSGRLRFSLRPVIKDDVVYLSDIQPKSAFVHGGLLRDRAYSTDRITLAGMDFPKGLTTHPETQPTGAYAEVIYDLTPYQGERKEFRALVGMQDGAPGSVVFRVDIRPAGGEWEKAAETDTMTDGKPPVELVVPLAGRDELRLYVTDAGDGINSDHAIWAMARLE